MDNTQYPLTSPTARAIDKEKPVKLIIDVLISCYRYVILLWTETQRGIQRGSSYRGRCQILSWNKNKTRARIMFSRPRSLKERCTWSMEKPHIPASAETMSEYWLHKTGTKRAVLDTVRRASWGKKSKTAHLHLTFAFFTSLVTP